MHAAQPTRSRVLQLLWFPFFFAAAFSVLLLNAFADPTPHDLQVAVVAPGATAQHAADDLDAALATVHRGGFRVTTRATTADAARDVRSGHLAAALVLPGAPAGDAPLAGSGTPAGTAAGTTAADGTARVLVATGAGGNRAKYVETVLAGVVGHGSVAGTPTDAPTVDDVAPVAARDASGVSLFFFSLPLLLVGLITSIVLLQLAAWPLRRKLAVVAATGAFAALVTFAVGTAVEAVPTRWWLVPLGFALTQVVGWLTVALPVFVKHFFMPVAMTFVLVVGIPTAGSTVTPDLMPTPLRLVHDVVPFGAYTDLARAVAYLHGAPVARPALVLAGWALVAVALVTTAARRAARARSAAVASVATESARAAEAIAGERAARIAGRVVTTSTAPVAGARVTAIDDAGDAQAETLTGADGRFALDVRRTGLWHVLVTAPATEPAVTTVAVHHDGDAPERTFTLVHWDDADGNLAPHEVEARWRLAGASGARRGA